MSIFIIVLLCSASIQATHMVGGEINYRCLGNDQYEITVTVFRDCDTGVPWFDDPAAVGVFDENDSLVFNLLMDLQNNDTLELNLFDPCLVAPPNVCIHTTTYKDTVNLPFINGGYQLVYQRCCRNQDIVNIVAPTSTGATYYSYISEEALLYCNSSAVFNEWPPVYICAGVPIAYDHSAFDIDGDSIVYELCTPFTGANAGNSMPQPPNNPPYNPVTWLPPYSLDNMLGGPDSLMIDPITGQLSGTPDNLGVFVVGVCAKEYRNGILISSTRRDFQYVVGTCGRISSAAFFAPTILCDNSFVVDFQNLSNSIGAGFLWDFGDSSSNNSSYYYSPVHIYPDTGQYTITLIADPGTLCADTVQQTIQLNYASIIAGFSMSSTGCSDTIEVLFNDQSTDSISNIVSWNWNFGNGNSSNLQHPSTTFSTSGTYPIALTITAANGCSANFLDTLNLSLPVINDEDTVFLCHGVDSILLNVGGDSSLFYSWSPAIYLNDPTAVSPLAILSADQDFFVTVTALNGLDSCVLVSKISVIISDSLYLNVPPDSISCADSLLLHAQSNSDSIIWSLDPNMSTLLHSGAYFQVAVSGSVKYYIWAFNESGCFVRDSVLITANNQQLNVNWMHSIASCDSVFNVQFNDLTTDNSLGNINSWLWDFGDGTFSNQSDPIHEYDNASLYNVNLMVITDEGCSGSLSMPVFYLIPALQQSDTIAKCQGTSFLPLNPNGNTAMQYLWSPGYLLDDSTAVNPITNVTSQTTFTVTITALNGLDTCSKVEQITVVIPPVINVSVPALTSFCGNQVDITAMSSQAISYEWSDNATFNNILSTNNPYTATPNTFPYAAFYVRATDAYGCTATDMALVQQINNSVNVDFTYQSLSCSDTASIAFFDLTSDTLFSPISSWLWTSSEGHQSADQNPVFTFTDPGSITVSLEVTLANGCSGNISYQPDLHIAALTTDSLIALCFGDSSVQLNENGDSSLQYNWSSNVGLSNQNAVSPLVLPMNLPAYYAVSVSGYGSLDTCTYIHNIEIIQAPPMELTVPKDTFLCASIFNVTATGSGWDQLLWSFSPTFNPVVINNVNSFFVGLPLPPFGLTMYVRAIDEFGCMLEDTARIYRVDETPNVNFNFQVLDCQDSLEVLFLNNSVDPPNSTITEYWWDFGNGSNSDDFNGFTQYAQSGSFIVSLTATAANNCSSTYIDTLSFSVPVLYTADTIALCGADSVQLNPGGDSSLIYQWMTHPHIADLSSVSPYVFPDSNTSYSVEITAVNNADSCTVIRSIHVNVEDFWMDVMDDTLLCNNNLDLYVNTSSTSTVEWALDRNFNLILGQGNPFNTNINDARWIYVRAESSYGCMAYDSIFVNYRGEQLPIDITYNILACEDSLLIQFIESTDDSTVMTYDWSINGSFQSSDANPVFSLDSSGIYDVHLSVTADGSCSGSVTRTLEVILPESSLISRDTMICEGDSIQLYALISPENNFYWTPEELFVDPFSIAPVFMGTDSIIIHLKVFGYFEMNGQLDSCYIEDSLRIDVLKKPTLDFILNQELCDTIAQINAIHNAANIDWFLNSDLSQSIGTSDSLLLQLYTSNQMVYALVQDTLGCKNVDSLLLSTAHSFVYLNPSYTHCDTMAAQISLINEGMDTLTLTWLPDSAIITGQNTASIMLNSDYLGIVQLIVENDSACVDTLSTLVNYSPGFNLSALFDSITCDSMMVLFANTDVPTTLNWTSNGIWLSNTDSLNTMLETGINQFVLSATDTLGCTLIDTIEIEKILLELHLDSVIVYCLGDSIQLQAITNDSDIIRYSWAPNELIIGTSDAEYVWLNALYSTSVSVEVENEAGCISNADTWLELLDESPNVEIYADQDSVFFSQPIQLFSTFDSTYLYIWREDSLLSALDIHDPWAYIESSHTFYLTVTNAFGCTTQDSIYIQYFNECEEPYIFMPNAFSPDGDGINDILTVNGYVFDAMRLLIYDRWGELIFETTDQNYGWDGTYKGNLCPPDVYGFYLECNCKSGDIFVKKGNVTLLR